MSPQGVKYRLLLACMLWKGISYYPYMEYNDKSDPEDGLPDEDVNAIDEIPCYDMALSWSPTSKRDKERLRQSRLREEEQDRIVRL
jgi:hypothetical protein